MPAEIRFHLDECKDLDQLAFATQEARVLITQDADFLRLAREDRPHQGIAYYAPGSRTIGDLISRLVLMHAVLSADEMIGTIEFI